MPIEIPELPVSPEPAPTPTGPEPPRRPSGVQPREARPAVTVLPSGRWYGVYPALVIGNRDPEGLGRVLIRLPWAPDAGELAGIGKGASYQAWARLATLAAGHNRGSWFLPDVDDEVLVSFEAGNPSRPVVVGALWNGRDTPPVTADAGNTVKLLRTRGGSEIRFDDAEGGESVRIRTAAGQTIRLTSTGGGSIEIGDGNGNEVTLASGGITLNAPSKVHVSASTVTLEAGTVRVEAGMVQCTGVVQCDSLITNTVVATTYTPGDGNIW